MKNLLSKVFRKDIEEIVREELAKKQAGYANSVLMELLPKHAYAIITNSEQTARNLDEALSKDLEKKGIEVVVIVDNNIRAMDIRPLS